MFLEILLVLLQKKNSRFLDSPEQKNNVLRKLCNAGFVVSQQDSILSLLSGFPFESKPFILVS